MNLTEFDIIAVSGYSIDGLYIFGYGITTMLFNPFPLRTAKTLWSFGRSECNRVKSLYKRRRHRTKFISSRVWLSSCCNSNYEVTLVVLA